MGGSTASNYFLPIRQNANWNRPSARQILSILGVCFGMALIAFAFLGNKVPFSQQEEGRVSEWQFAFREKRSIPDGPNEEEVCEAIFASIDPGRIASTLRLITKKPHVAGTAANRRVAQNIAQIWRAIGLEQVHMLEYDVLLSYPKWNSPNHAYLLADDGKVLFKSKGLSPDLLPHDGGGNSYQASIQWLAYSANGTVEGVPIYCHYGRNEDFERLEREFGISRLDGKIAIMRYGKMFRGDKVRHAQSRGAAAVILFNDPVEAAWLGQEAVFPHTDQMPSVGVQRGTLNEYKGDVLTPLLPARKEFYSGRTIEEAKRAQLIPSIPAMPMPYGEVQQILSRMAGRAVPKEWQGGLNFTYHLGPGFRVGQGQKLRVEVKSSLEVKTIQNVIGIIPGREEPDSWVLLGNHHDAWVFGSIDPNSGTAVLAEVARAFVEAHRMTGWRPRRTLVFCAWDAEEEGLIGSTEFVQEFAEILRDRAVVYLNVDLISGNQTLNVLTMPSMYKAVTDAAKVVPNPMHEERAKGRKTMFDTWNAYYPSDTSWLPDTPRMKVPAGGVSDYMSFLSFLGVPVADFSYMNASWSGMNGYPLYHSRYEVPFVNEHLFDHENLAVHKAVGQFWAELARSFVDSPLLPFNASTFAQKLLEEYLANAKHDLLQLATKFPEEMASALRQMNNLERQAKEFLHQSHQFELHAATTEPAWANRRLQKLEQCFINPSQGIAEKEPEKRHVLFSTSDDDSYSTAVMVAVHQKINEMAKEQNMDKRKEIGHQLAMQLTIVQYSVLCATNLLKPFI